MREKKLNHLDLFSGIGGFSLAAEEVGIKTIGFSEIDKFANKVLEKNFPNVKNYGDIRQITRETIPERVDIITGGFPCQSFSVAGKKKGREDERDLWPEMFRVIKEFQPTWVIGENVANFVNMEFERTNTDLESEGYEVLPFIIPACGIGAPHKRERVWIIGYSSTNSERNTDRWKERESSSSQTRVEKFYREEHSTSREFSGTNTLLVEDRKFDGHETTFTNTKSIGLQGRFKEDNRKREKPNDEFLVRCNRSWKNKWTEVATHLCGMDDELSNKLYRSQRLKALGNSIVPAIAYVILKYIVYIESYNGN